MQVLVIFIGKVLFQSEMKRANHEFFEILMNYQRARKHLLQCEAALKSYEESYRKSFDEVWITEMKTQTVKVRYKSYGFICLFVQI